MRYERGPGGSTAAEPGLGGRGWIRAALWIGLAGAALWLVFSQSNRIRLVEPDAAPRASELLFAEIDGRGFSLEDLRGEVVLVNLWAGWCAPCRAEVPRLRRLHRDFGERGLVVLGVSVEELPPGRLIELTRELGIDYRVVLPGGPLQGTFRTEGVIPHTWLVDRAGRVRGSHSGLFTERSVRRACEKLLAEPG